MNRARLMAKGEGRSKKEGERPVGYDRKSEICQKALDLFIKKGYDATPMSMIAKVLGMSKANLYYYFSSKEDLLYQIHLDDLKRRFIPIIEEAERLRDPEDRVVLFLRKFTLMCTSSPASRVLVHEIRSLNEVHYYEITSIWRRAYKVVCGAIKELQDSGRARKLRESFLTFLGTGMVFWIVYWFDYSRQANAEELAETLVEVFLNGLLYSANEKP
jgi:AcrR family transcriptional regulator